MRLNLDGFLKAKMGVNTFNKTVCLPIFMTLKYAHKGHAAHGVVIQPYFSSLLLGLGTAPLVRLMTVQSY